MDESAHVIVHESTFPREVTRQLLEGLRARRLDQKFFYLGLKQTLRWLALHEAHSPARTDPATKAIYEQSYAAVVEAAGGSILHLVGLAAGGGQKETGCLEALRASGRTVFFTPCDVSLEMALSAHEEATSRLPGLQCTPLILDLPRCTTLPALLKDIDPGGTERLVTLFGAVHGFEPGAILPRLLNAVRSQDTFLLSANLLPEQGYEAAMQRILPQYENRLTEEWLMGFLEDLGIRREQGALRFSVAEAEGFAGLKRIEAHFDFQQDCEVRLHGENLCFAAGESLRLFFSYRYTARFTREVLVKHGLEVIREWISPSGEEGLFLCKRPAGKKAAES